MYDYRVLFKRVIIPTLNNDFVPFPIQKSICTGWASSNIRYGGDTILYTGCMYQIAYLSSRLAEILEKLPENFIYNALNLTPFLKLYKPPKAELDRAYNILRNISNSLKRNGIDFGYLYEDEPYSGALLLEAGFYDEFSTYAKKVTLKLREKGVKKIITVDPHSLNAFERYREFINNFDIEIYSYLDLIKDVGGKVRITDEFVVHDSCLYSKFLNRREKYRDLAKKEGIRIVDDWMVTSLENSLCCGAPLEVVNPQISRKIAKVRLKQLKKVSKNILVACPFCYANLSKVNDKEVKIKDIAEYL